MFDSSHFGGPVPAPDLARNCREPAERWCLDRRARRPAPPSARLPRVATS